MIKYTIKETEEFFEWQKKFKNGSQKYAIIRRLRNLSVGLLGDYKDLKGNLFELRFFNRGTAGLRIYYTKKSDGTILLLLSGGDKGSQEKDIQKARQLIIKYREFYNE